MFALNNVFLCLNRLGVKFFQISGSMLQLQRDRNRFTAVGRGAKAGSVWAPSASRISTRWMERLVSARSVGFGPGGFVVVPTWSRACAFHISHPRGQKLAFLSQNTAGSENKLSFEGQALQCFLC